MSAPSPPCYLCRPDKGGNVIVAMYLNMRGAMPCRWICDAHAWQLLDSPLWTWLQQPAVFPLDGVRRIG